MTVYGYVRVSTDRQGAEGLGVQAQTDAILARYSEAQIVVEVASGAKVRPALERLLSTVTSEDTLVAAKLDRLGRSVIDVVSKLNDLNARGVPVVVLDLGIDTSTPAGRFATTVLIAAAELERNLISQRTTAALAAAKTRGIVPGPKGVSQELASSICSDYARGTSAANLADHYELSRSTVYRIINKSTNTGDLS